jgi:hypothetical protein
MIEAFKQIAEKLPEAKLVVAGGDHPQARGYTESVRRKCVGNPRIEFRGYVPEDALADLFQSSTVAVMPYSSSTGCSGVAHLACAYGVPIVSADLADFRQMAQGEELALQFYPPGNAQGLADCLIGLLQNPEEQQRMAAQNFAAALRMTMPNVVQKYLRHFELQQRVQTLKYVSRFRRLPSWMPSKSLLLRLLTRNSLGWARRSAVLHTGWNGSDDFLPHGNGNGGGQLNGIASPLNGNGIAGSRGNGIDGSAGAGRAGADSAARRGADNHRSQGTGPQNGDNALPLHVSDQRQPKQAETEERGSEQGIASFAVVLGGNTRGGNGKNGAGSVASGSNGSGRKRAGESLGQPGTSQGDGAVESA